MRIESLTVYPVRSCAGVEVDWMRIEWYGPRLDRQFMLVDLEGRPLEQKDHPKLCLIKTHLPCNSHTLMITAGSAAAEIRLNNREGDLRSVILEDEVCTAIDQGDRVAEFFSNAISMPCRLVRYDPYRFPRSRWSDTLHQRIPVSFTYYPLLVISRESLDDLNTRLEKPLSMDRFRPNMVVVSDRESTKPYEEDKWPEIKIHDVVLQGANRCARCAVTTTNQQTAKRGKEPLRTLAMYRRQGNKVFFGRNFIVKPGCGGLIHINDPIEIPA